MSFFVLFLPRCLNFLGYEPVDLQGLKIYEFINHPRSLIDKSVDDLVKNRKVEIGERTWKRKDGKKLKVLVFGSIVIQDDNEMVCITAQDLTDLKKAEEEYLNLIEVANEGVIRVNNEDIIQYVNHAFCKITGYSQLELIGHKAQEILLVDKQSAREMNDRIQQRLEGKSGRYEIKLKKKSGEQVWVFCSGTPVMDVLGNVVGSMAFTMDVSERKRIEQSLVKSKQIFEALAIGLPLKNVLSLIIKLTETTAPGMLSSILLLDHETKQLKGGAAPSLPNDYNDAVDGLEIGEGICSCGESAYTGKTVIVDDINVHPTWANPDKIALAKNAGLRACWSEPIFSSDRQIIGTLAMYYREPRKPNQADLDLLKSTAHIAGIAIERRLTEEALQKSEERYRSLFEKMEEGLVLSDAKGVIHMINPQFANMTGYSEKELVGKVGREFLLSRSEHERVKDKLTESKSQLGQSFESEIVTKNGKTVYVNVSRSLIYNSLGEFSGIMSLITDITFKKQQEIQVLNALLDGQEKERKRISQELHDGLGQRLAGLMMNLVALNQPNQNQEAYNRLVAITEEAISEYRAISHDLVPPALKEDGLQSAIMLVVSRLNKTGGPNFTCKFDELEKRLPLSTETELFRITQELINNALKYAKATQIDITLKQTNGNVSLSVKDDGIGFNVQTSKNSQNGIGLNNVCTRATLIGGNFNIKSTPGKGTVGTVIFSATS